MAMAQKTLNVTLLRARLDAGTRSRGLEFILEGASAATLAQAGHVLLGHQAASAKHIIFVTDHHCSHLGRQKGHQKLAERALNER